MKVAVSIPDDVFKDATKLARKMKATRSHLYSRALAEFVVRHAPDQVTQAWDRVCEEVKDQSDPFVSSAARRILEKSQW